MTAFGAIPPALIVGAGTAIASGVTAFVSGRLFAGDLGLIPAILLTAGVTYGAHQALVNGVDNALPEYSAAEAVEQPVPTAPRP